MKLVLAEKPSVAREIAQLLGASEKRDGYLEGNGHMVAWAFGHLVGLGMPEDYGISGFQKEVLPILPKNYILTVRKLKKEKGYINDPAALKQLKVIKKLFDVCDSIIVATDAGREGELIFRYIYEYLKCTKPFERLWISSLTENAIKKGFENLKPGNHFDGLFQAAQSRSRADWLVGINATQALTLVAGDGMYSLGRVQTPTLELICRRYLENKNFEIEKYWQIELLHTKDFVEFTSISKIKMNGQKQAEDILKAIERNNSTASITKIEKKKVTEQAPLLFDLTGLQKEANKKLNFSAKETLNIAQSLYEKKFITYPRTGSKYIPEDVWADIPDLIRNLQKKESSKEKVGLIKWGNFNKRIVNNLGINDHYGLLTTEKFPSALSVKENAVYDMIAFRLLEAVTQPCVKEITDITLQVLHYDFLIKGCKVVEIGWRSIQGNYSKTTEHLQELPELKEGTELKLKSSKILEKQTQPPILYTEAGLLSAMENAGKQLKNKNEQQILKNIGIGTPATRASTIETLFSRNYIKRENKSLIPTEKGLQVYHLTKNKKIANVTMTAEWELSMQKIESNELSALDFQKQIEIYAASSTHELLQTTIERENLPKLQCPKCKSQQLTILDKTVKCPDQVCNWMQFRNVCGIQLKTTDIEALINAGKTYLIKGMKSKNGKLFNAYIVLNNKAESSFEFEK
ncbi:type IA DNA topoisomerase [Chryseobacterium shandongense]|uniref:DNA topoisomerase n=1 Tax=Chryseobacterium shandongense TaxID=1493872 RepID=A0AAD0YBT9_9FLAO|nr:type IA DNA topoisomerase [Chryseobacterium shandongense]AZA85467.1 type IA DNA topoisomerase [Chryseobacterium shandongense]AZA97574.1 type IA DNA topoisomerase [Chryseobacterium shandongense]